MPYEDGIFESAPGYFTQTISFEDVTYQLLNNDPKELLFGRWHSLINFFDDKVHFQFNYGNMEMNREEYQSSCYGYTDIFRHSLSRQEQGLMSSLPLGNNSVEAVRSFITKDIAAFIPFQLLSCHGGLYNGYGGVDHLFIRPFNVPI